VYYNRIFKNIEIFENEIGGHLNPALTVALTIARRFPWRDLPFYCLAQYLGALCASGTVLGIYYGMIIKTILFRFLLGDFHSRFHYGVILTHFKMQRLSNNI